MYTRLNKVQSASLCYMYEQHLNLDSPFLCYYNHTKYIKALGTSFGLGAKKYLRGKDFLVSIKDQNPLQSVIVSKKAIFCI